MHKLIASLALTFLFVLSGIAQERQDASCRLRFAVVQKLDTGTFKVQPDDRDSWGQWPEDAKHCWAKDGNKKYSELCEAARSEAEFVVAWEREAITKRVSRKVGESPRTMCGASDGCREWEVPIWADLYLRLDRLLATLYWVGGKPQQFVPVWSWAKEESPEQEIGKEVFERALKALRKEIRNTATRKTLQ
jgi:hypothetical protein